MPDSPPAIVQAWIDHIIHAIDQHLQPLDRGVPAQLRLALMDAHRINGCPRAAHWLAVGDGRQPRRLSLLQNQARDYDLLLLIWPPGYQGDIHDHDGQNGFEMVLDGTLIFETYAVHSGADAMSPDLLPLNRSSQRPGDAAHFGGAHHAHRCINPSTSQPALSLHIYMRPIRHCRLFHRNGSDYWQSRRCDLAAESPANLSR